MTSFFLNMLLYSDVLGSAKVQIRARYLPGKKERNIALQFFTQVQVSSKELKYEWQLIHSGDLVNRN